MTRKLTSAELQMNVWRRWRKKQSESIAKTARVQKARKKVERRWSAFILWNSPNIETRRRLQLLKPEW